MQITKSFTPIDPATLSTSAAALLPKVSEIASCRADGTCSGRTYEQPRCYSYLPNIYETATVNQAAQRAKNVMDTIRDLEANVSECRAYLELLTARVRQLEEAAPFYTLRLSLVRYRPYHADGVRYTLRVDRVYPERFAIDPQPVLEEVYKGSERRVALKRLDELRRAYPGIDEHIDIEKKAWETR